MAAANTSFHLNEEVWNELPQIVAILGLFAKKMAYLQKENITLSDVYGVWLELESFLEEHGNSPLAQTMLAKLSHRKIEYNMFSNDVTLACLYLDLRYHVILNQEEKDKAERHLMHLWEKMSAKIIEKESAASGTMQEQASDRGEQTSGNDDDRLERIIQRMTAQQSDTANPAPNEMLAEFNKFKQLKCEPIKSNMVEKWSQLKLTLPILYQLAMTVLAVAPTEVSCERNFSTLDFILTKRRNRLTDINLQMILFLKLNAPLFYSAFDNGDILF